jgi:hypothetical protein
LEHFQDLWTKNMSIVELNFILSWNQRQVSSCSLLRMPFYFTSYTRNHVLCGVEKLANLFSLTPSKERNFLSVL